MIFKNQPNPTPAPQLPKHIAIIMDGNGRWAKKRGLPRTMGHREGAKAFRRILDYCQKKGLEYLTVYAFSTENWKRPKDEVDSIMKLLEQYLDEAFSQKERRVRVKILGDTAPLSPRLQEKIARLEQDSAQYEGMTVNVALNYGGRDELVHAARALARQVQSGQLDPEAIDEATLSGQLYTAGQPDPDLIIRPSGEERLSNFLIWQAAYAEFVFQDVLWPDYTPQHLEEALEIYYRRSRRFGGI